MLPASAPRSMPTDRVEPVAAIETESTPEPARIVRAPRLRLVLLAIVTVAPPAPRFRVVAPPTEKLSEPIVTLSAVDAPRLNRLNAPPMFTELAGAKTNEAAPVVLASTLPVTFRASLTVRRCVPAPRAAPTEPLTLTAPLSVATTSPAPVAMARPRVVTLLAALVPRVSVVL